jgi:hypothetical protein
MSFPRVYSPIRHCRKIYKLCLLEVVSRKPTGGVMNIVQADPILLLEFVAPRIFFTFLLAVRTGPW